MPGFSAFGGSGFIYLRPAVPFCLRDDVEGTLARTRDYDLRLREADDRDERERQSRLRYPYRDPHCANDSCQPVEPAPPPTWADVSWALRHTPRSRPSGGDGADRLDDAPVDDDSTTDTPVRVQVCRRRGCPSHDIPIGTGPAVRPFEVCVGYCPRKPTCITTGTSTDGDHLGRVWWCRSCHHWRCDNCTFGGCGVPIYKPTELSTGFHQGNALLETMRGLDEEQQDTLLLPHLLALTHDAMLNYGEPGYHHSHRERDNRILVHLPAVINKLRLLPRVQLMTLMSEYAVFIRKVNLCLDEIWHHILHDTRNLSVSHGRSICPEFDYKCIECDGMFNRCIHDHAWLPDAPNLDDLSPYEAAMMTPPPRVQTPRFPEGIDQVPAVRVTLTLQECYVCHSRRTRPNCFYFGRNEPSSDCGACSCHHCNAILKLCSCRTPGDSSRQVMPVRWEDRQGRMTLLDVHGRPSKHSVWFNDNSTIPIYAANTSKRFPLVGRLGHVRTSTICLDGVLRWVPTPRRRWHRVGRERSCNRPWALVRRPAICSDGAGRWVLLLRRRWRLVGCLGSCVRPWALIPWPAVRLDPVG